MGVVRFRSCAIPGSAKLMLREPLELRGMSQPPDSESPRNLIFTLRALLGVNARAEIMGWLLTHESGHPAAIARSTGYFSKSIQQILNEMTESGQVSSIRIGREKHFSISHRQRWQTLLCPATDENEYPGWIDWMPLFSVVTHFAATIGRPGFEKTSVHFQAAKFRETLDQCAPALPATVATRPTTGTMPHRRAGCPPCTRPSPASTRRGAS